MSDTHGSGRLAQGIRDARQEPWDADAGMLLGRVVEKKRLRRLRMQDVRFGQDTHHLIVASAGSGKFVSSLGVVLRDMMLTDNAGGSMVVIDPKGEALRLIGKMGLRPFGLRDAPSRYDVLWLDPFDLMKAGTWSLNPIAHLGANNPNATADAKLLAWNMVESASAKETHWDEKARTSLTALLLYVAQFPDLEWPRDLITVRRLSCLPWDVEDQRMGLSLRTLCADMMTWRGAPDAVITGASGLMDLPESTREGYLSSLRRDPHWIDDEPFQRVIRGAGPGVKEIDAREVALQRKIVFVVIPDDYTSAYRGWLRLVLATMSFYFRRYQHETKTWSNRRHIFIDEWPNLQKLEATLQGVTVTRGLGVMWHLYCQEFVRPQGVYGKEWESFFSNSLVQAFGVGDMTTLEYLSRYMDRQTVVTSQLREGESLRNLGEAGRRLMTPGEIAQRASAASNQQLLLRAGYPPLFCSRYAVYWWKDYCRVNPAPGVEAFSLREASDASLATNPTRADLKRFAWWRSL
jgi:type IV secretory pathway TraG/TraD family ATPase VirD4